MNIHIPADFTLSELRAFIEGDDTQEAPEGYYTAKEWAEHFDLSIMPMRELLRQAMERGLLQRTRVRRETLDGRGCQVPMYALQADGETSDSDD